MQGKSVQTVIIENQHKQQNRDSKGENRHNKDTRPEPYREGKQENQYKFNVASAQLPANQHYQQTAQDSKE
jgi:hypothetical protein